MTNKKNKHKNNHHNNYQPNPKHEINEEELCSQCLEIHELLKDRTSRLRKLESNEMCYMISTKWLREWKDYVGYDATVKEDEKVDKRYYGKRYPGRINIDITAHLNETREFYSLPK